MAAGSIFQQLAKLIGVGEEQAEEELAKGRAAKLLLSRRELFGVAAAASAATITYSFASPAKAVEFPLQPIVKPAGPSGYSVATGMIIYAFAGCTGPGISWDFANRIELK